MRTCWGGVDNVVTDRMQKMLDRMAKLQAKTHAKGMAMLDSKVSKIMDLMGFDPEEGGGNEPVDQATTV